MARWRRGWLAGGILLTIAALPARAGNTPSGQAGTPWPSLAPIIEKVLPAVVSVAVVLDTGPVAQPGGSNETASTAPSFDQFLRRYYGGPGEPEETQEQPQPAVLGSGFIIDPAGYIVTSNHVIDHAKSVTVLFQDNTRHPAHIQGRDPLTDIAVLKIDAARPLPSVHWGDSDTARVGDYVIAIGDPYGLGGTVTAGIISARGRDIRTGPYDDFIQIDAAINRGNSGGPAFNLGGEAIGINSQIYSPSGGWIGIGFAIPANLAKPVVDQLIRLGRIRRGWLGAQVQAVTPAGKGALVADVAPDGPAAKAGLEPGDVIEAFDDTAIGEVRDLSFAVAHSVLGGESELKIRRGAAELTLRPVIAEAPSEPASRRR